VELETIRQFLSASENFYPKTFISDNFYSDKRAISISNLPEKWISDSVFGCAKERPHKNIVITYLKNEFAYKYKKVFLSIDQNVLLNELFLYRIFDLEAIYSELITAKKLNSRTKKIIQDIL
jgi:hypothetical protein